MLTTELLFWLVVYQVKHFLADYPLQTRWMLKKFSPGLDWVGPLAAHAFVHGVLTFGVLWFLNSGMALRLALMDFAIHFCMDRVKASPGMMGRWKAMSGAEYAQCAADIQTHEKNQEGVTVGLFIAKERMLGNKLFWWCLGVDQMVHHLTHYLILFLALGAKK